MSTAQPARKTLIALGGVLIALCLPAFTETPLPDREKRKVGDLDSDSVIPVAANSPGRFGAYFKTRVVIFNPTDRDYFITAILYDRTGEARTREVSMDAFEYRVWDNFLEEVFGYRGSGGIWLTTPEFDDRFYVTAEVYTDSPNGRFSTTVVNGIYPLFSEGYESNFNVGINVNASRRTNIGVLNWGTAPSSIEAKVYDGYGTLVQTIRFNLEGEAWQQNSISARVDDGFVVWDVNGESDKHYFYAVEVDNESNDGTLNWSVKVDAVG